MKKKKEEDRKKVHPGRFFSSFRMNDGQMGRHEGLKHKKEERKRREKGRKKECAREKARKRWRNLSREKKKKREKNFTCGGATQKQSSQECAYPKTTKAHTQTHARISSSPVCSFSFFVFVIRARIRHHFWIRERDENAADDDDDDFIIGRRRIFAIIFTIIEEEK